MITLLHEEDHLHELESLLPAGLLITRSLRNFKIEANFKQSFTDLYKNSLEFENLKERLFGPQEDELGEEGLNRRLKYYFTLFLVNITIIINYPYII
jgi:hypothetical protein